MHHDLCDGKQGLCDKMKPTKGITLLHYLRKVDFEGKQNGSLKRLRGASLVEIDSSHWKFIL